MIYKWNSKAGDTGISSRDARSQVSRGPRNNQGSRFNNTQYNNSLDHYILPSAEQRRLHDQHV